MFVFSVHPNVSQGCQGGCATCSDYNGCLSCKPRLFFVLERIGMKQIGVCLSSCPSGYYGTRYPDINKCASKCWGKGKRMDLFVLSWMLCPLRSQVNREADGWAVSLFVHLFYSSNAVNINPSKRLRWKITKRSKAWGSWLCMHDLPKTRVMVSSSTPLCQREARWAPGTALQQQEGAAAAPKSGGRGMLNLSGWSRLTHSPYLPDPCHKERRWEVAFSGDAVVPALFMACLMLSAGL